MKYIKECVALMLCCALCVTALGSAWAAHADEHDPDRSATVTLGDESTRVQVSFVRVDRFADFRSAHDSRDHGRPAMMAELQRFLTEQAKRWLPDGQRLLVVFSDIDLAGRVVPVRGSGQFQRIVEDFYPPRMNFSFEVLNHLGEVEQFGQVELLNRSFLNLNRRAQYQSGGSMPYEKAMLQDWFHEQFSNKATNGQPS